MRGKREKVLLVRLTSFTTQADRPLRQGDGEVVTSPLVGLGG